MVDSPFNKNINFSFQGGTNLGEEWLGNFSENEQ